MVSKIKLFLTLVFLQALIVSAQINYYVSPSGNNSNSGSISSPWKTVQFAITIANSGDTLNLANGTFNEKINCTKSGLYIRNKKNESLYKRR